MTNAMTRSTPPRVHKRCQSHVLAVHVDCLEATCSSERRAAYFDGVFKVAFRLARRSRSSTTNECSAASA
jgi:hypothetical protein